MQWSVWEMIVTWTINGGGNKNVEKWTDLEYILEVEPTGLLVDLKGSQGKQIMITLQFLTLGMNWNSNNKDGRNVWDLGKRLVEIGCQ